MTLLELLVVIIIIGVLLAVAIPSYIGFVGRASTSTAEANLRSVVPAVESYFSDHATYDDTSMTVAALRSYNPGLASGVSILSGSDDTYCIKSTYGAVSYFKNGPSAPITTTACS